MWAMDRFVPMPHHDREMSRHLRVVPDAPEGALYVVGRSVHAQPGTPYVIAKCADRAIAAVFALSGQQIRTRSEMLGDSALADALRQWDAEDDSVFRMERRARAALKPRAAGEALRAAQQWHPSQARDAQG